MLMPAAMNQSGIKTFAAVASPAAGVGPPIQRPIRRHTARRTNPPAMTLIVWLKPASSLEVLSEAANLPDFHEAYGLVSGRARVVRELGVGRELHAPLSPCPILGGCDQRAPDPFVASLGYHVPAFEVGDAVGMAALGVRTDRQLGETNELIGPIRGDENGERLPCAPVEERRDLGGVLGFGVMGPQCAPHAEPGGSVTWCENADDHGWCLRPVAGGVQGHRVRCADCRSSSLTCSRTPCHRPRSWPSHSRTSSAVPGHG